jgi:hypothetical protein
LFLVSSGRTGSTFLARMIHRHPRLFCVSDLFEPVGEVPYFDRSRKVDGREFFEVLSGRSFPQRIAYWREEPTDELLYLPDDDAMVSLLLCYTLPFAVGGDPMDLYRELEEAVAAFGRDEMANHTLRFFDWLRDRFGKDLWIERTGGSLPHMRRIVDTWPDAKIVHNYRDCRETAISMMTGSFFRLYLELGKDPDLGHWDWAHMPPIEEMGTMLNAWIVDALDALAGVPEPRKMALSYESVLDDPETALLDLCRFVFDRDEPTAEDVRWAKEEARAVVRPPLKFPELPRDEQGRLQASCAEGLELLGYF